MIEFEEACFSYGAKAILRDVTLTLAPGSFHFLIGPSGVGKTTFLRMCYLDLAPTSGVVRFYGQAIEPHDRDAVADLRKTIGVVHQDCQFLDHLPLAENIALPLHVSGLNVTARTEDLHALLEWVDLTDRTEARPPELSGGERQRAALARAVILSPEIILADEPTGNVDWEMALRLLTLLVELNRMGKTVVIATHDLNLIRAAKARVAARVLRLAQGRIQPAGADLVIGLRASGASDAAGRVVPGGAASALSIGFVAATMAFFAVLVLALALAAGRLADAWSGELADTATLHVFAADDAVEAQALAALNVLRTTPGVRSVRILEVEEQRALLAPWFGADLALDALPLPLLIEVVADRERLNRESLELRLAAEAPGATFDDHAAWRQPLIVTAGRLRIFAFACLGLMTLALAAVLSLAATAAIAANAQVIHTLRLIGARDSLIAAAFTRRFTAQAVMGAAVGSALGLGLLALLPAASEHGFFLVGVGLQGVQWLAPLGVPVVSGAVAWLATRLAARRNLRRWS